MLNADDQRRRLDAVVKAASAEGLLVAPVGSLYFLYHERGRIFTKDIDAVLHNKDLTPASLEALKRVATQLGSFEVSVDQAVVMVTTTSSSETPDIELIRGRSRAKGGFFPRSLLEEAATKGARDGNLVLYPLDYMLVLKADAVIDREERAKRDKKRAAEHLGRAKVFREDLFGEANRALLNEGLERKYVDAALRHLKQARREPVRALLVAAGIAHAEAERNASSTKPKPRRR